MTADGTAGMTACPECGASVPADSRFCPACGSYLGWQNGTQEGGQEQPLPSTVAPAAAPAPTASSAPAPAASSVPAPAPAPEQVRPGEAVVEAVSRLASMQQVAEEMGRHDLGAQLARTRSQLERREVTVAVIGEFKRGKSTLVNALLRADVCPVDADIVTAVPTTIRYGTPSSAVASIEDPTRPGVVEEQPVALDALVDVVGERGRDAPGRVRSVDVRLDLRMLASGLCLVDTPGVGGLESAHGAVTLAALASAQALVFVTDASQELTAPEVAFLKQALERCERAVCVVTKTDLFPAWRRVTALDEEHLRGAGLTIPVVPVSSFLRLRARSETGEEKTRLNAESGFKALYDWLATEVLQAADHAAREQAEQDIDFAQRQLTVEVETERMVLEEPERAPEIMERLEHDSRRRRALAAPGSSWQQALAFGIEDLVADVQHDLAERMKKLLREAEGAIDETDPKTSWETVGAWLQKQVIAVAGANFDLMRERAADLADEVAEAFAFEAGVPLEMTAQRRSDGVSELALAQLDESAGGMSRTARLVFVGRTAALLPMMTFGLAGHLVLMSIVGPLAIAAGVGIGAKIIRDERARQVVYRRQVAKAAVRRYVDDVQFVLAKDCRDALAVTRRDLLVEFQARAEVLQFSSERAASAVRRAAAVPPEQQAQRISEVEQRAAAVARAGAAPGERRPA